MNARHVAVASAVFIAAAAQAQFNPLFTQPQLSVSVHPRFLSANNVAQRVWFTDEETIPHKVGYVDAGSTHAEEFAVPCNRCDSEAAIAVLPGIVATDDGGAWFNYDHEQGEGSTIASGIGHVTATGQFTLYPLPDKGHQPVPDANGHSSITVGPDGNIWFTENAGNRVGKITPSGAITEYALSGLASPSVIVRGPDGNLWFTETTSNKIARITPAGSITEFSAGITPIGLATGADGNLWFTEYTANRIGRLTRLGVLTEFPLTGVSGPLHIVAANDGSLYFTLFSSAVGRINSAQQIDFAPIDGTAFDLAISKATTLFVTARKAQSDTLLQATITNCTLSINPTASLSALLKVPFETTITASDGSAPYSFEANGLPAGMTIDTGGRIHGAPSQTGVFVIDVVAHDASGCIAHQLITLSVDARRRAATHR